MTHHDLYRFIDQHRLTVLATVSPSGAPEAALMGFAVSEQLEIVFDTVKTARKYPNLKANPKVAFVFGLEGAITLQYEGEAEEPSGEELRRYQDIYFRKLPDGPNRLTWPGITYFKVRPAWIRYCDYNQRPPLKLEFEF